MASAAFTEQQLKQIAEVMRVASQAGLNTDKLTKDMLDGFSYTPRVQQAPKFPFPPYPESTKPNLTDIATNGITLEGMICLRLFGGMDDLHKYQTIEFLAARKVADGRVVVFIIEKGEPVTLIDDSGMFPSDTLITQLRLILADKLAK